MASREFDEPMPRIAILGAGPIGLEAALYARFLGYPTTVYERGAVAHHLRQWGHVTMLSPFGWNCTPLGRAALQAQDPKYQPPGDDQLLTGHQYLERYLLPLAHSDLVEETLRLETEVIAIGKAGFLKQDAIGSDRRAQRPFHILLRDAHGQQLLEAADLVIDATGTFGQAEWLGPGGIPAVGELAVAERIEYGLPDVRGAQASAYAGCSTLVVGSGHVAAATIVALAELVDRHPDTRVSWITRGGDPPLDELPDDPLPARQALARRANQLAAAGGPLQHWPDTWIVSIQPQHHRLRVQTEGAHGGQYEFDRVVANVGYRPQTSLLSHLQVDLCFATEGARRLVTRLLENGLAAGGAGPPPVGVHDLLHPEPGLFIVGAKSYGCLPHFLLTVGYQQIRDVFTVIGQREDLDLYRTIKPVEGA